MKAEDEENLNGSQSSELVDEGSQESGHNPGHNVERRQRRDNFHFRRHPPPEENKLYQPVKLSEKVYIPIKEHPKVAIKK